MLRSVASPLAGLRENLHPRDLITEILSNRDVHRARGEFIGCTTVPLRIDYYIISSCISSSC
jgi:hypothetical protein